MLTSIYYYRYYRPYMLRTVGASGAVAPKRAQIAQKPEVEPNASFLLNKSLKVDVVMHARQTSASINGIKDGARRVVNTMESFNQYAYERGPGYARDNVGIELAAFTDSFNTSIEFMTGQTHSHILRDFAEDLATRIQDSRHELKLVDIHTDDGRLLTFQADNFYQKDEDTLNIAFGHSIGGFLKTYRDASEMLTIPLTEHMNFQGLNYYYNYRLGTLVSDTFKIIESGLIINKRL